VRHQVLAALILLKASAYPQSVAVRGLAYDSLHGKPLSGAFIGIPGTNLVAVSDSAGQFTFGAVPVGPHRFVMQHDVLDAVGLSAAGAQVVVTDGKALVTIAVPSFTRLWKTVCGPTPPGRDTGFVFGSVSHGKTPLSRAVLRASWIDVVGDSTALRTRQRALETETDSTGTYTLCGVPTKASVSVRVSAAVGGTSADLPALGTERIMRRDLNVEIAAPQQAAAPVMTTFTGHVVKSLDGAPISDADVILVGPRLSGSTNARGEFRIANVPAGSHTVQIRKIGFSFRDRVIDFPAGAGVEHTLQMSNITTLDSVKVTTRPYRDPNMDEFEERRKIGRGHFVTRAELLKAEGLTTGHFLQQVPNVVVHSGGGGEYVLGRGARCSATPPRVLPRTAPGVMCEIYYVPTEAEHNQGVPIACFARVFLDNALMNVGTPTPPFNLRDVPPTQIEAMELYARSAEVPPKYANLNSGCGVLVIHTRRPK
jgi:hypothetical protein